MTTSPNNPSAARPRTHVDRSSTPLAHGRRFISPRECLAYSLTPFQKSFIITAQFMAPSSNG